MATYNRTSGNSGYNNSGYSEVKDPNTQSIVLYSQDGLDPSRITCGYWKNCCSIKFTPALPKEKQAEGKIYDYDQEFAPSIIATLTNQKRLALLNILNDFIIPNLGNNEIEAKESEKFIKLKDRDDNSPILAVGLGKRFDPNCNNDRPYIVVHNVIDGDKYSVLFEFIATTEIGTYYDHETGEKGDTEIINSDLLAFVDYVKSESGQSNAIAHSVRDTMKYVINGFFKNQNEIKNKLGIKSKRNNNYQNTYGGRNIGGNKQSQNDDGSYNEIDEDEIPF